MSKAKEKTFEEALQRLEEIVQSLEGDASSLDESLKLFEEGKGLIVFCQEKLNTAEQKLTVLAAPDKA